ncbi:MAG: hypothetical protein ACMZ7B_08000 [Balneola sp.]
MSKNIGTCKHCREENVELQKKSHVLSKFLFENILADGNSGERIIIVDPDSLEQKGKAKDAPYEKYIYCRKCEREWSSIETKASQMLFHKEFNPKMISKQTGEIGNQIYFKEAEIEIFKKFMLLNLYRANNSNHGMFTQVNLGVYNEIFRNIMLGNLNLEQSNCTFHIFSFKEHIPAQLQHFSTHFIRLKIGYAHGYSIFVDGIGFVYNFGKSSDKIFHLTSLDNSNGLAVNFLDKRSSKVVLKSLFQIKHPIIS